jgi:hypothetical protein
MRPSVEADWLTSGGDTGAMCGPVHGARRRTGYAANADLSDVVLNETQRAGLRWIADGRPDGVMEATRTAFRHRRGAAGAWSGSGPRADVATALAEHGRAFLRSSTTRRAVARHAGGPDECPGP